MSGAISWAKETNLSPPQTEVEDVFTYQTQFYELSPLRFEDELIVSLPTPVSLVVKGKNVDWIWDNVGQPGDGLWPNNSSLSTGVLWISVQQMEQWLHATTFMSIIIQQRGSSVASLTQTFLDRREEQVDEVLNI